MGAIVKAAAIQGMTTAEEVRQKAAQQLEEQALSDSADNEDSQSGSDASSAGGGDDQVGEQARTVIGRDRSLIYEATIHIEL